MIFATYCLNKKKFCVCFFKYLFTAALLSAMAHSLRESASPPSRLCSVLRFFDVSRVFCFVWCAPSVGEHAELFCVLLCFYLRFCSLFTAAGSHSAGPTRTRSGHESVPQPRRNRRQFLADFWLLRRRKNPPVDSAAC